MIGGRLDRQSAASVKGERVFAEDDSVDVGIVHGGAESLTVIGEGVLGALCQSDEDLVCLSDQNAGRTTVLEGKTI